MVNDGGRRQEAEWCKPPLPSLRGTPKQSTRRESSVNGEMDCFVPRNDEVESLNLE